MSEEETSSEKDNQGRIEFKGAREDVVCVGEKVGDSQTQELWVLKEKESHHGTKGLIPEDIAKLGSDLMAKGHITIVTMPEYRLSKIGAIILVDKKSGY